MPETATKESRFFSLDFSPIVRQPGFGPEMFEEVLNKMGVDSIVKARRNGTEHLIATPEDIGVEIHTEDSVAFRAYAYLSPIGHLQIWMEASNDEFSDNLLAVGRFSWVFMYQSEEWEQIHREYTKSFWEKDNDRSC